MIEDKDCKFERGDGLLSYSDTMRNVHCAAFPCVVSMVVFQAVSLMNVYFVGTYND
jgi:hypothetical protein